MNSKWTDTEYATTKFYPPLAWLQSRPLLKLSILSLARFEQRETISVVKEHTLVSGRSRRQSAAWLLLEAVKTDVVRTHGFVRGAGLRDPSLRTPQDQGLWTRSPQQIPGLSHSWGPLEQLSEEAAEPARRAPERLSHSPTNIPLTIPLKHNRRTWRGWLHALISP